MRDVVSVRRSVDKIQRMQSHETRRCLRFLADLTSQKMGFRSWGPQSESILRVTLLSGMPQCNHRETQRRHVGEGEEERSGVSMPKLVSVY